MVRVQYHSQAWQAIVHMLANNRQHQVQRSGARGPALQASPHADFRVEAAAESTFSPCTIDGSEWRRVRARPTAIWPGLRVN
jgi:hypothetical protein